MAGTYVEGKHDLGLLRQDGSIKWGFYLATDPRTKQPLYRSYYDDFLSTRIYNGDPGYNQLTPEKEFSIRQDSWEMGFANEFYNPNTPKKYFLSSNCDLRFSGMAIAGPLPASITTPPAEVVANANMEADTSWTGGAWSDVQAHGGTYSWQVNNGDAYQDLTWDNTLRGATVSITGWIFGDGAGGGTLILNDGISDIAAAGRTTASWGEVTATGQISSTATRLRVILRANAGISYFDDITTPLWAAGGTITCKGVDFNSAHYVAYGTILAKLNSGGTAATFVWQAPAAITSLEVFAVSGTSYLFIALGTSTAYRYMSTAQVVTTSTAAVNTFQYFQMNNGAAPNLWGNDTTNAIRYTPNPLNGGTAWSAQTTVDSSTYPITGMFSESNTIYIAKTDRLYYLDSAGVVQRKTEETVINTASTSGKGAMAWKGDLFYPCGTQALWWYDSSASAAQYITPGLYAKNQAAYVGRVSGLAGDDVYLYGYIENSTGGNSNHIIAGRQETIDGVTDWYWHSIGYESLTTAPVGVMWVTNIPKKRLYFADSSSTLQAIPLTSVYGNITADTNYTYPTGGSSTYWETSWLHAGFKSDVKAFIKLTCKLGHSYDADIYWQAQYKLLEDTAYTTIGNFTGSATSMIQTIYLPADTQGNKPKSTLIRLRFLPVTDDTSKTPILLDYDLRGIVYPTLRRMIECEIEVDDDLINNQGQPERGGGATTKAVIEEAMAATWPVTFYDYGGATIYVKFLPPCEEILVQHEQGRNPRRHYRMLLEQVTLS